MSNQAIELIVTLAFFGAALLIVSKLNKGKKRGDPRNYYMGEGQLFDPKSIAGNVRTIILGILVCVAGWHLDEFGRWLWRQFGNELIVSSGKETWHRIVSTIIGMIFVVSALIDIARIFFQRRGKN
jgi:cytochrome bd-type quinol oxidase subunit 1